MMVTANVIATFTTSLFGILVRNEQISINREPKSRPRILTRMPIDPQKPFLTFWPQFPFHVPFGSPLIVYL